MIARTDLVLVGAAPVVAVVVPREHGADVAARVEGRQQARVGICRRDAVVVHAWFRSHHEHSEDQWRFVDEQAKATSTSSCGEDPATHSQHR